MGGSSWRLEITREVKEISAWQIPQNPAKVSPAEKTELEVSDTPQTQRDVRDKMGMIFGQPTLVLQGHSETQLCLVQQQASP